MGKPQSREHLAELLWPERAQKRSLSNFRTALARLRRRLGAYLEVTRQTVGFNEGGDIESEVHYWLDVAQFEAQFKTNSGLENLDGPPAPIDITGLTGALELYRGDFLAGFSLSDAPDFEEWIILRRELSQAIENPAR